MANLDDKGDHQPEQAAEDPLLDERRSAGSSLDLQAAYISQAGDGEHRCNPLGAYAELPPKHSPASLCPYGYTVIALSRQHCPRQHVKLV